VYLIKEDNMDQSSQKIAIICSRGSLDGIYPALILANGARMEGMDAMLFFTFFGLEAITKDKMKNIQVATVGNPAMHIPTMLGGLPGMSRLATHMMMKEMDKLDIPHVDEFIEMLDDAGAEIYACKLAMDMFHLKQDDLDDRVKGVLTVGEFYEKTDDAKVIFT